MEGEQEASVPSQANSRGCTFYFIFVSGILAFGLILTGILLPAQLVFETKPYARIVLSSGQLDSWTARQLGLNDEDYQFVKDHYMEYLAKHRRLGDGDSSMSDEDGEDSSSSDEDISPIKQTMKLGTYTNADDNKDDDDDDSKKTIRGRNTLPKNDDMNDDDDDNAAEEIDDTLEEDDEKTEPARVADVSSFSSSDAENGVDSDPYEDEDPGVTLERMLQNQPLQQTIGLGLFKCRRCFLQQNFREMCETISVQSGLSLMGNEVTFISDNINMETWNNMRVEAIFTAVGCAIGLMCLLATLRPCCENERLPVNLGSVAFVCSGILIFVPIVRLMMIRGDFVQNLEADINITTSVKFSWSLLIAGCGSPFALLAGFLLIGKAWVRETRRLYRKLVHNRKDNRLAEKMYSANGTEERVRMVPVSTDEPLSRTTKTPGTGPPDEEIVN